MAKLVKSLTPSRVDINKVVIDRTYNVREDAGYEVASLIDDLALRGQQDAATLEKLPDGTFRPIKGFRRATAILEASKKGLMDPLTQKPFDSIVAIVYEGLEEHERIQLLLDHGQRRGLNKVELFHAFERAFSALYTEKDIVTLLRDLLEEHYPPTKKIENTPEAYLNYYRGVVQTNKRAWASPNVLRDAWVKKLRGEQNWPNKAEMEELQKVFQKEADADRTNKINKANPGPEFMNRWNQLVAKQAEAAALGQTRAKSSSMMNRDTVEKLKPVSESAILKTVVDVILRQREPVTWGALDKFLTKIEAGLSAEDRATLDGILAVVPTSEEAASVAASA